MWQKRNKVSDLRRAILIFYTTRSSDISDIPRWQNSDNFQPTHTMSWQACTWTILTLKEKIFKCNNKLWPQRTEVAFTVRKCALENKKMNVEHFMSLKLGCVSFWLRPLFAVSWVMFCPGMIAVLSINPVRPRHHLLSCSSRPEPRSGARPGML